MSNPNLYDYLAALFGLLGLLALGAAFINPIWFIPAVAIAIACPVFGRKGNL